MIWLWLTLALLALAAAALAGLAAGRATKKGGAA